jgi:hypothetical protein
MYSVNNCSCHDYKHQCRRLYEQIIRRLIPEITEAFEPRRRIIECPVDDGPRLLYTLAMRCWDPHPFSQYAIPGDPHFVTWTIHPQPFTAST